ncbi:hypothetical protein BJ684DRAFT_16738 [Piptocephalis cylindrospora]|uniref:Uncharacterized protein n=1 Tax=Piptocephalis cylindrospora TaxID=1907219 RepID=A0A4V1IXZ8_9FUNG|nr:hypothetical protein BJ684DRAFT_16738 [Piptocephalis cylindrospora]|eukprot:RKP12809.1 hypothetical protein BJ684DRAFT_16738 [Piptocephalis cylindrospora]
MPNSSLATRTISDTLRVAIAMALVASNNARSTSKTPTPSFQEEEKKKSDPLEEELVKESQAPFIGDKHTQKRCSAPSSNPPERYPFGSFYEIMPVHEGLSGYIQFVSTCIDIELSRVITVMSRASMGEEETVAIHNGFLQLQSSLEDSLNGCFGFVMLYHLLESLHPHYPKGNDRTQYVLTKALLRLSPGTFPSWIQRMYSGVEASAMANFADTRSAHPYEHGTAMPLVHSSASMDPVSHGVGLSFFQDDRG